MKFSAQFRGDAGGSGCLKFSCLPSGLYIGEKQSKSRGDL